MEWFEEFGLADGAVDEDAIVLSFENDESDEQEEELDEEGSITSEKKSILMNLNSVKTEFRDT